MNTFLRTTGLTLGLLCALLFSNQTLSQGLTSVVDRTSIEMDESITLKVIFDAFQAQGEPDFTHLSQNFDIVSNNRSSQQSYVNGTVTASTEWRMVLFPKTAGQLLIPPFSFQGYTSEPITINVSKGQAKASTGIKPDVFIETSVDKTDIFVQEQAIVTYRLYFNRSVSSLDAENIKIPSLRVEELPRADYQKTLGHVTYGVAEFRYALVPDASGDITIPAYTWTIESTDRASNRFGFNGGRSKLHRIKTDAINLSVKPKPDAYPFDSTWLPASELELTESWSQSPEKFKLGEPITRTVTIKAKGVSAEQLPPIFGGEELSDFKFYPDKPSQENQASGAGLAGTRTESIAIVPSHSGDLTLPAISITWWDTNSQSTRESTLPAVHIHIDAPAKNAGVTSNSNTSILPTQNMAPERVLVEKTSPLWLVILGISITLNLILFALLVWFRQGREKQDIRHGQEQTQKDHSLKRSFNHVTTACSNRDALQLRTAILAWAALMWPEKNISGLQDIGRLSNDNELQQSLEALNRALFSENGDDIDYNKLQTLLQKVPKSKPKTTKESTLQTLYGT